MSSARSIAASVGGAAELDSCRMTDQAERSRAIPRAARGERLLLLPNPWDLGSARLFESLGFEALATTSTGFAVTLGRLDGSVSRDEAIAHAASIAAATDLPVSADLENGFADDPAGVAETIRLAADAGLAGARSRTTPRAVDDTDLRARPGSGARRRRRRGRPRRRRAPGPHRAGREPPARARRPGRHDRPPAGLPGGRRRRPLRAGPAASSRTSASSSRSVDCRSTSSPGRAARPSPSWPRSASAASRSAAPSPSRRCGAAAEAARELLDQGTYEFWKQGGVGAKPPRRRSRPASASPAARRRPAPRPAERTCMQRRVRRQQQVEDQRDPASACSLPQASRARTRSRAVVGC